MEHEFIVLNILSQSNLLASGSSNCEIIIWDINDTSSPMSPGAKPNISADVTAVAWNR